MNALDRTLENLIGEVPGLGVIIYKGGAEVYSKFFGRRVIESSKPVTRDTRFRAASVSKMFTVFTLMQLVERGKLDLDADISEYLGFELRNPNQPREIITARMLASHTSSLRDGKIYSIPPEVSVAEFFEPRGEFWEGGEHFAQEKVGEYFTYCNLNYGLLGTIIENLTGKRFDLYQRENILRQLDARADYVPGNLDAAEFELLGTIYRKENSWLAQMDDFKGLQPARETLALQNPYAENFQGDYDLAGYRVGTNATIFSPQGGLRISFEELAHALGMLMNGGIYRGQKILDKKSVETILKPQWIYDGHNGDTSDGVFMNYGLGVYRNGNLIGHTGEAFGLLSGLYLIPNGRSGFVFMISGAENVDRTERRILNAACKFLIEERN